ncbi:MAG: AAA family ATPase [Schleiferiaceae bacterium]|nr:AAA family ATPase [Schleiferiaceae bacterium]
MNANNILAKEIRSFLPFMPGQQQDLAIEMVAQFCVQPGQLSTFLLKGYAGTGKTSLVAALVSALPMIKKKSVLLAPTGRAAKVLSLYAKKKAFTIHKHIYFPKASGARMEFTLKDNKYTNTVFIVDEASMISDDTNNGAFQSLLEDLLLYVSEGRDCQLILIGDTAQLPPVGQESSPALDSAFLRRRYGLDVQEIVMTEVMRQKNTSSILENATRIREVLELETIQKPKFITDSNTQRLLQSFEVMDVMNTCMGRSEVDESVVVVRSNKRANLYNKEIRARVQFKENELEAGDHLMIVKNNYYWLPKESEVGFIANGDVAEVLRVQGYKERYGCRYAEVQLQLVDYEEQHAFEALVLLNTIDLPAPSLTWEQTQAINQQAIAMCMEQGFSASVAKRKLREDPYINALQVKFSYAITCHKAQGGQWEHVLIEQAWLPTGEIDRDYLRWLYTALTRSKGKVYLMGFDDTFFE